MHGMYWLDSVQPTQGCCKITWVGLIENSWHSLMKHLRSVHLVLITSHPFRAIRSVPVSSGQQQHFVFFLTSLAEVTLCSFNFSPDMLLQSPTWCALTDTFPDADHKKQKVSKRKKKVLIIQSRDYVTVRWLSRWIFHYQIVTVIVP